MDRVVARQLLYACRREVKPANETRREKKGGRVGLRRRKNEHLCGATLPRYAAAGREPKVGFLVALLTAFFAACCQAKIMALPPIPRFQTHFRRRVTFSENGRPPAAGDPYPHLAWHAIILPQMAPGEPSLRPWKCPNQAAPHIQLRICCLRLSWPHGTPATIAQLRCVKYA